MTGSHDFIAGIPLVLGGNVFGWTANGDEAFAVLDAFYEAGGRMIDTADVYSAWIPGHKGGESERLLGELGLSGIELLGPVPAPMERRAGRYRAQLLVQASARAPLHRLLNSWMLALEQMPSGRAVRCSLDVDPIDLF